MNPSEAPRPDLAEKIARFPTAPGVYTMMDGMGRILYIGKAVNLRARVRSYFGKSSDTRVFHRIIVKRIVDVDCIVTGSEAEALILENNLIKKHRPVYNIRLKDDKSYVSIKVTTAERWPMVLVVRRYKRDGNTYFGPYGSASSVREMLRVIKKVFPLRTCSDAFFKARTRPCMEHEIGRCTAPCVDLIPPEKYREHVEAVVLFLRGKDGELARMLEGKMVEAADGRQYELAARYRNQIRAIEKVFETQKAQDWELGDLDVFSVAREGDLVHVEELSIRDGKVVNSHAHPFRTSLETQEVAASFLSQYYLVERYIPPEILCDVDFPERPLLEEWLRSRRGARVDLLVPGRGEKARLIEFARKNALNSFAVARSEEARLEGISISLQQKLDLSAPPRSIECCDISNFQGDLAVGALVRFEDGLPVKDRYRKYRVQTVVGADDFRCIEEVLGRRLRKGVESRDLPDLLVVDGGKGQLGVATRLIAALGISGQVGVIGLAKERRSKGTPERIFVPGRSAPLPIPQESPESLLLQRIRDEAHRFAVRYHRELRRKATLRTGLEDIPGIGRKRRQLILDRFGTLRKIREASEDEIASVVGARLARVLKDRLSRPIGDEARATREGEDVATRGEWGSGPPPALPRPGRGT